MSMPTKQCACVHSGHLILVNADHPLCRETDSACLVSVGGDTGVLMARPAAAALEQLMAELHGWQGIVPVSGWRSQAEQQAIWDSTLHSHGGAFTQKYVAQPGCSEHQTGLAIDLGLRQEQVDFICPDFPDSGICGQFRRRAAAFGFLQRYEAGKELVTGIACEPWHFRYVGVPHAELMTARGLALEEYHDWIKQYPYDGSRLLYECEKYAFLLSYLPMERAEAMEEASFHGTASGNNADGFLITQWKDRTI